VGLLADFSRELRAETDEKRYPGPADDFWYSDNGEYGSDSGIRITPEGALKLSTIWKCVNWRARMFGMLPKKLFERTEKFGHSAQVEAREHPLFDLIHSAPSPLMTSMAWFGLISADLHLWGNSYAFIERDDFARIRGLWRLSPNYVTPKTEVDPRGRKRLWYEVTGNTGTPVKFYPDEILHIRGLALDGISGLSPIRQQMNLLGWFRATGRYGGQFFKNASRPSGVVSVPQPFKDKAIKQEVIDGLSRSGREAGKLLLVEGAVTYHKLTMDQDEAQFILTYQLQEEDICGVMEVKPHEVGIMRHMTNNNVEQETISSVTRTLTPFAVNVEQWLDLQLLSDAPSTGRGGGTERDRYFHQVEVKALLRGDMAAQTQHIREMIQSSVYSPNHGADFLGIEPFEGGDRRFINGAMIPLDRIDDAINKRGATSGRRQEDTPQQALRAAFRPIFHQAIARSLKRTKRDTAEIFGPLLEGLAEGVGVSVPVAALTEYLAQMDVRAELWSADRELSLALTMIESYDGGTSHA
jgi:HK97 family phage portal protein